MIQAFILDLYEKRKVYSAPSRIAPLVRDQAWFNTLVCLSSSSESNMLLEAFRRRSEEGKKADGSSGG
jgi:hypothetical protein